MPLSEPGGGAFNEDSVNRIYSENAGVPSVDNVFYVGTDAGLNNVGGDVIAIGSGALDAGNVADGVIAIGRNALGAYDSGEAGAIAIGDNAAPLVENMRATADDGAGSIFIGRNALATYEGSTFFRYNVLIGEDVGGRITGSSAQQANVMVGYRAGYNWSSAPPNFSTFIGREAGGGRVTATASGANGNTGVGDRALHNLSSGSNNTALGKDAGQSLQSGIRNTFIGYQAGESISGSDQTTLIGMAAGQSAGDDTICIGYQSGTGINSTDTDSIVIGTSAVSNAISGTFGNNNIVIGTRAADYSASPSPMQNAFVVEYGIGGTNVPFLYGEMNNANLMIGGSVDGSGNPDQRSFNGGINGCLKLQDVTTAPSGAVGAGGILFVDAGALKFLGGAGTVTTVATA